MLGFADIVVAKRYAALEYVATVDGLYSTVPLHLCILEYLRLSISPAYNPHHNEGTNARHAARDWQKLAEDFRLSTHVNAQKLWVTHDDSELELECAVQCTQFQHVEANLGCVGCDSLQKLDLDVVPHLCPRFRCVQNKIDFAR
jgi:hypothetical protein